MTAAWNYFTVSMHDISFAIVKRDICVLVLFSVGRAIVPFLIWIGAVDLVRIVALHFKGPYHEIASSVISSQCLEEHTCTVISVCALVISFIYYYFFIPALFWLCVFICVRVPYNNVAKVALAVFIFLSGVACFDWPGQFEDLVDSLVPYYINFSRSHTHAWPCDIQAALSPFLRVCWVCTSF